MSLGQWLLVAGVVVFALVLTFLLVLAISSIGAAIVRAYPPREPDELDQYFDDYMSH